MNMLNVYILTQSPWGWTRNNNEKWLTNEDSIESMK